MGEITGDGTAVNGLGGPSGFGETALPRGDEGFAQVDVSAVFEDGFVIDGVSYGADDLFISTDGFITFGTGVSAMPSNPSSLPMPFIAPFMADIDTRIDGEGTESGQVWVDIDTAQDCVTITWEDVGFYRRNATYTNTFQLQLFDRGNGAMDVVFRYDSIEWTSGDLQGGTGGSGGTPATIGYRMDASGAVVYIGASGDEGDLLALPDTNGNTGVPGLFVFRLGGSPAPIKGGTGADTLFGTAGSDTIQGLGGNDALMGSSGADKMDGGGGTDQANFSGSTSGIIIDLLAPEYNSGWAEGDKYISIESFVGTSSPDEIYGDAANSTFDGAGGNDVLDGQSGNDTLFGNKGDDTVIGGNGNDLLEGNSGDDKGKGGDDDDWLSGGTGNDSLLGENGNDLIDGNEDSDTLFGGNGDDTMHGGAANDTLKGQNGIDSLDGGGGADSILGGNSGDWLYGGNDDSDTHDTIRGGGGDDFIFGGFGTDSLIGEAGNDSISGGGGTDNIYGKGGNDTLLGGDGKDFLQSDGGNDLLWGGGDNDTLTGGPGLDLFKHSGGASDGTDLITDYKSNQGDVLVFGLAGATAAQFSLSYRQSSGGSEEDVFITYVPTGQVLWILEDGEGLTDIAVQSGSSSFMLL